MQVLFQSTHPSGVRRWGETSGLQVQLNFNPRTPVGCDRASAPCRPARKISIHAPQWGATTPQPTAGRPGSISIHAPQWGATTASVAVAESLKFQSTHPSGVRRAPLLDHGQVKAISIHTPQWGATSAGYAVSDAEIFQSTHPSGVRLVRPALRGLPGRFQSTHPSGVRQSAKPTTTDESEFQSTHPSGVRPWSAAPLHLRHGFQSTHPSGVRLFWFAPSRPPNEFQSTHPSGVRPSMRTRKQKHNGISIHAPQWGATRRLPAQGLIPGDFNPRTPVGCDPSTTYQEDPDQISIHAPQWGATFSGAGRI